MTTMLCQLTLLLCYLQLVHGFFVLPLQSDMIKKILPVVSFCDKTYLARGSPSSKQSLFKLLTMKNEEDRISLQTVDIKPFIDTSVDHSVRLSAANQLLNALTSHGCFYVVGHGINETESLESARNLFSQAESTKQEVRKASRLSGP